MNKKLLLLLPAALLALSSCGGGEQSTTDPSKADPSSTSISSETTSEEETSQESETSTEESTEETTSEESSSEDTSTEPVEQKSKLLNAYSLNANFAKVTIEKDTKFDRGANKITVESGAQLTAQQHGFTAQNYLNIFVVINGVSFQPKVAPDTTGGDVTSLDVDVIIPDEDFNLFVYFQNSTRNETGYTVTLNSNDVTLIGSNPGDKFVYFSGYVVLPENELIDNATYKLGDGEVTNLPTTNSGYFYLNHPYNLPANVYQLTLGRSNYALTGNVEISINHSHHDIYKINYVGLTEDLVQIDYSSIVYEAYDSTKVSLYFSLKSAATTKITSDDVTLDYDETYYSFIMPKKDVTIKIEEAEPNVALSIAANEDITYAEFHKENDYYSNTITKGYNDTTVYLFVAVKNNIKPTQVSYDGKTANLTYKGLDDNENDPARLYVAQVKIPATGDALEVSITTATAYSVTIAEDIELSVNGGSYFVAGETVTALYSDESLVLVIKDKEGNVLDIEQTRYESRRKFAGQKFTMPECDIVLSFGE